MARRRSQIQIGPGGVVYVSTTALILASALYTQANLLFWSLGLMIGGLVVSIGVSILTLRKVTVQRLLPTHGVAGEPLVLRYSLTHRGWLPIFGLVVSEAWGRRDRWRHRTGTRVEQGLPAPFKVRPFGWVLHLGPGQTVQAEATCWPLQRGPVNFDRVVLATSFPFGVIRKIVQIQAPGSVLVYPSLYRIDRRVLARLSRRNITGHRHLVRAGGTEEFFGLRQYRPGDSLKMIDWKRSAKTGDLITREMTKPSPPRIMLALDLSEPADDGGPEYEGAISLAASLVCDAHFHGYPIGMVVIGVAAPAFPIHHSMPHRSKLLETLALLDTSNRSPRLPAMPTEPTVIVTLGRGSAHPLPGGQVLLGAAEMDQYVEDFPGGAARLLNPPVGAAAQRDELTPVARPPFQEAGT